MTGPIATTPSPRTVINVSEGLANLLARLDVSLAFTSYQSGHLFMVGRESGGRIAVDQQQHERAMGVHWDGRRLHLATGTQVIRFENMLHPGEVGDGRNDAILVPRLSWTTNDLDTHEVATDASGRPLFVATRFNCIATVDAEYSFAPVWLPAFIDGSEKGDRCHLNGMAMNNGALACVSMAAAVDELDGWRGHRDTGGVIIDCRSGRTLAAGLSMPHSPRISGGALWFLEAGRGTLARIDLATDERRDIAFLPGFARGLALTEHHAIVTVSKPRNDRFEGLRLDEELASRNEAAQCAVLILDISTGAIVGWIRFEGQVQELFDVAILPGFACPRSLGPGTREIWDNARPRTT